MKIFEVVDMHLDHDKCTTCFDLMAKVIYHAQSSSDPKIKQMIDEMMLAGGISKKDRTESDKDFKKHKKELEDGKW